MGLQDILLLGESVKIIIGGVPYQARTLPATGLRDWVETVQLREDVGDENDVTSDESTAFYRCGCVMNVMWDGSHHPVSGERQVHMIDSRMAGSGWSGMTDEQLIEKACRLYVEANPGVYDFTRSGIHGDRIIIRNGRDVQLATYRLDPEPNRDETALILDNRT